MLQLVDANVQVPSCYSFSFLHPVLPIPLISLQIRFLADPTGEFTRALDLAFNGGAVFGGDRSKRYALVIENGKVKQVHVEPDNTGVDGMYFSSKQDDYRNLRS